jgi:hypothetical protein
VDDVAGHVARMGNIRENVNGRDHYGDLGIHGKIILEWMLKN